MSIVESTQWTLEHRGHTNLVICYWMFHIYLENGILAALGWTFNGWHDDQSATEKKVVNRQITLYDNQKLHNNTHWLQSGYVSHACLFAWINLSDMKHLTQSLRYKNNVLVSQKILKKFHLITNVKNLKDKINSSPKMLPINHLLFDMSFTFLLKTDKFLSDTQPRINCWQKLNSSWLLIRFQLLVSCSRRQLIFCRNRPLPIT